MKPIVLKTTEDGLKVHLVEEGTNPVGTPRKAEIKEIACGISLITFNEGENQIIISVMPISMGGVDIAVTYARILDQHKLRRMAVGVNQAIDTVLNKMVNEMIKEGL